MQPLREFDDLCTVYARFMHVPVLHSSMLVITTH